ncbi:ARM repeat-containing protein [Neocallimastix californiae]|jgi:hypothetical protein|uniref:ARM repeat-containing protein n=1 Tax=Neocallimastix californiae TaxID=1754190 RepID=A0A1Y2EZU0_9FUNG|nr:ARM repeat-containing protein [Neocallimastix californiae]|eukprot:ORY77090.1 ARM repeat-containing protein [Neocallimastix californiae]
MDEQQYLANLEQLLKQVTSPDSNAIKQATEILKQNYFNNENCIPALVEIISNSKDTAIRNVAAVELPKRIRSYFDKLDDNLKSQLEQRLLEIITVEPQKIISHAIARCISAMAEFEIPNNRWTNLIEFLFECCKSQNPNHREVGVFVLYSLFEIIVENLTERLPQIFELLSVTINDPESIDVKITTMKALGSVVDYIDEKNQKEIELFRSLIPNMVNVLLQCLEQSNVDGAQACFDVVDNLLTSETQIVADHFSQLVQLTVDISKNVNYDESIRNFALSTLFFIPVYKKNPLIRLQLVKPIIDGIFPIGAEEEPEDEDEDCPARLTFRIINCMATNLPPNYIFPVIMEYVVNYMQNPNPLFRKAALMSLCSLIDGCADLIRSRINDIFTFIAQGLQDSEPVVRKAACISFFLIAMEMVEEVSVHHSSFVPLIFNLMNDSDIQIQRHATNALNVLLEGLNEDIVQYLPMLAEKFVFLLENGAVENKAVIVEAIGSAALSASDKFLDYFEVFYPRIFQLMSLTTGTEELLIRGNATGTMGSIAEAVGKEIFRPYVQETMKLAMESLSIDSPKLKEQSFFYFAILAKVFGDEFTPFLEHIMPPILESLNQSEDFNDLLFSDENAFEDMDDEEAEEKANQLFNASSAIAEEKEFAADCLQEIFAATKQSYMPYFEQSVEVLKTLLKHDYEGVRKSACNSLISVISTCYGMSNPEKWQPGLPVKVPINQDVATLISQVMPEIVIVLNDEEDKVLVMEVFQTIALELKNIGPALIVDCHKELANVLLEVLKRTHPCQIDYEEDNPEQLEETEYESIVISSASDVIASMALVLGEQFKEYFEGFYPSIVSFYSPAKATNERNMAIGTLGEIAAGIKGTITPYTEEILKVLMAGLKDENNEVNSNAAYSIGVLCENTQLDISSYYPEILSSLSPLFNPESLPQTVDNACGAVARLLLRYPTIVPIEEILPTFFNALPLKSDYEENVPVVKFLQYLFESQNPFILNNKEGLSNLFQAMLSPPETQLNDECRAVVLKMAQSL